MPSATESSATDTRTLRVDRVARDRLVSIATTGRPSDAIAELIWNGLDADAMRVEVKFRRHRLGGISAIEIIDDGSGIPRELAQSQFRRIGGSWKRKVKRSAGGRPLQGKEGQGRLRAFSLGDQVRWTSISDADGERRSFEISGTREKLDRFELGAIQVIAGKRRATGTRVRIDNVPEAVRGLEADHTRQHLERLFSGYLQQYPELEVVYDGRPLDRNAGVAREDRCEVRFIGSDGHEYSAQLRIVEWERAVPRRTLFFCDARGHALHEERAAIQAPHFEFTAYVSSERIAHLAREGLLEFDDLHPETRAISRSVRDCLREHFRQRSEDEARSRVEAWRDAQVYPYEDDEEVVSEVEVVERAAFDACARQIEGHWPQFAVQSPATRRLVFDLLRRALEAPQPSRVEGSLIRGLGLSEEKARELAHVLSELPEGPRAGSSTAASAQQRRDAQSAALDQSWARWCQGDVDDFGFIEAFERHAPALWPQSSAWRACPDLSESLLQCAQSHEGAGQWLHLQALELPETVSKASWLQLGPASDASGPALLRLALAEFPGKGDAPAEARVHLWLLTGGGPVDELWLAGLKSVGHAWASRGSDRGYRHCAWHIELWAAAISPGVARDACQAQRPEGLVYAASEVDLTLWVRTWQRARVLAQAGG